MRAPEHISFELTLDGGLGTVLGRLRTVLPRMAAAPDLYREIAPNPIVARAAMEDHGTVDAALRRAMPHVRLARTDDGAPLAEYLARARSFMLILPGRGDALTVTAPSRAAPAGKTVVRVGVDLAGVAASAAVLPGARARFRRQYARRLEDAFAAPGTAEPTL